MKKTNIKKLLRKLPRDTEIVVKAPDGSLHTSWPVEIKYTSDGTWIVLFNLSDK